LAVREPSSLAEPAAMAFAILTLSHCSRIHGMGTPTSVFPLLSMRLYIAHLSRCVIEQYPSEYGDGFGGLASAMQETADIQLGSLGISELQAMARARVRMAALACSVCG
jgi:hypothetical protein